MNQPRDAATVNEKYCDYSLHKDPEEGSSKIPYVHSSENNFPVKLHYMLKECEKDGLEHIVSWQIHGRAIMIHKPEEFEKKILPNWFRQTKYSSFQRQLNIYGFQRISSGPDKSGYYHELFLRGKQFLAKKIQRTKFKGNGPRKPCDPDSDPNFYAMPYLPPTNGKDEGKVEDGSSHSSEPRHQAPVRSSEPRHQAPVNSSESRHQLLSEIEAGPTRNNEFNVRQIEQRLLSNHPTISSMVTAPGPLSTLQSQTLHARVLQERIYGDLLQQMLRPPLGLPTFHVNPFLTNSQLAYFPPLPPPAVVVNRSAILDRLLLSSVSTGLRPLNPLSLTSANNESRHGNSQYPDNAPSNLDPPFPSESSDGQPHHPNMSHF